MSKTYTSKSNANRAARKAGLPESAVSCDAAGLYSVNFPVAVDGVDGPGQDDVPVVQVETAAVDPVVLLACADGDYGLCRASDAARNAQDLADSERLTITTRDAITDAVIGTYEPTLPPDAAFEPEIVAEDNKGPVALSDTCVISFCVANTNAMAIGQLLANKYGVAVRLNDMLTNASLTELSPVVKGTKAPKPAKAEKLAKTPKAPKEPKVAGEKKAREPRAAKLAPSGMRLQIIEACCRKSGATPGYLNDLTKWKKAPWKWLMSNPKGTGLCDRYGYTLTVGRNVDDKGAVYKMTKNAA